MDLYKILEIRKNASPKTIKKAYHLKVLKYHPDKNPNTDIKKYHQIQAAYDILIDEEKKKKYDSLNKDDTNGISEIFNILITKMDTIISFNKIKIQFNNILNNHKNIVNIMGLISKENLSFNDILGILSNLKTNNLLSTESETNDYAITESEYKQEIEKTKLNIVLNINTNMKDIYNDKSQEIVYMRKVNNKDIKETVTVPLISDQVIFDNLGDECNSSKGDLIININIVNNLKYRKRNTDLVIRFEISLYQLFNGLVFSFIHLDDQEITLKIDDCFKYNFDGEKFKYVLKNKGILDVNNQRGDLVIYFILDKEKNFDEKLLRFFG